MRFRAPWLLAGCAALTAACGLSVTGLGTELGLQDASFDATESSEGSVGAGDATSDVHHGSDAGSHADSASDGSGRLDAAAPDGETTDDGGAAEAGNVGDGAALDGACDPATAGCVIVPPGWTLVAFAPSQTPPCPSGFQSPSNVVEGPDASAACTCGGCSVTGQPSCASGQVGVYYDYATVGTGTCATTSLTGPLHNSPAGACGGGDGGDMYHGPYNPFDIKYVSPPPSGGTCSAPGAATGNVTYTGQARACVPVSPQAAGCVGDACMPTLPSSYKACLMQSGTAACPAGPLTVQHVVGSGVSFSCSDCGCAVAGTCSGTVSLYTDTKCKTFGLALPADGTCINVASVGSGSTNFNSYTYDGGIPAGVHCTLSGPSTAQNVALAGPATICCAP